MQLAAAEHIRARTLACKQVGNTLLCLNVQTLCVRRQTHIRLNNKHKLAGFRNGIRKVQCGGAFALATHRTRYSDNSAFLLIGKRKVKVRTQKLVCFGSCKV